MGLISIHAQICIPFHPRSCVGRGQQRLRAAKRAWPPIRCPLVRRHRQRQCQGHRRLPKSLWTSVRHPAHLAGKWRAGKSSCLPELTSSAAWSLVRTPRSGWKREPCSLGSPDAADYPLIQARWEGRSARMPPRTHLRQQRPRHFHRRRRFHPGQRRPGQSAQPARPMPD